MPKAKPPPVGAAAVVCAGWPMPSVNPDPEAGAAAEPKVNPAAGAVV